MINNQQGVPIMGFSYVALGDSLLVGVGATFFSPGFVERYKRMIEMKIDETINSQVLAKPGLRTIDIVKEMKKEKMAKALENA